MKRFFIVLALLAVGLTIAGCGGGSSTTLSSNPQAGAVFVTGEDAPCLPS
jgi:ABC-type glycerol-3-phosphate transport system substrate-binding protein